MAYRAPEIGKQSKAVAAGQPGIRSRDQQVDIGIRAGLAASPGAVAEGFSAGVQANLRSRDELADRGRHAQEALLDRWSRSHGHESILLQLSGLITESDPPPGRHVAMALAVGTHGTHQT
jgi:hypothetical protein